ncbi:hypothetical protein MFIFM68171_03860 [Madurella fahalii]|uniref:DUF676 domain-containing protein n=1 Tax=Madurella fahalii TaxID=1157608 RepID=A0ABQ0G7S9_9PEZI
MGAERPWIEDEDFLGPLKDKVRILSFGYNANRFGEVANTRIIHHANTLLRALVRKRIACLERPIIFIAHSLGGIVVKKAILLCPTNDDWDAIKAATKGIIFMGTPHMGSEQAGYLHLAQNFLSLMTLQQPTATNLTKELEPFSTTLQDINQEFSLDIHRSINLICFYESIPQRLPHGRSVIIVPQWSAVLQGVESQDLSCTHSDLPKFKDPMEARFETFWGEVQLPIAITRWDDAYIVPNGTIIPSLRSGDSMQDQSSKEGGTTNCYSVFHGKLWMGDQQPYGQLLITKYVAPTRTVEGFPLSSHGISISNPNIGCQQDPIFRVRPGSGHANSGEIFRFLSSDDSILPWPPTAIRQAERTMKVSSQIFQVQLPVEGRHTYSALDPRLFSPNKEHCFRGIWIGEYTTLRGFEFFLLHQPIRRKLEAIKITGDVFIPRGEYAFTVDDCSPGQSRWVARARWRVPPFGVRITTARLDLVNEDELKLTADNMFSSLYTLTLKRISWSHTALGVTLESPTM